MKINLKFIKRKTVIKYHKVFRIYHRYYMYYIFGILVRRKFIDTVCNDDVKIFNTSEEAAKELFDKYGIEHEFED